jgi:mRNA interferase RelE/StbE
MLKIVISKDADDFLSRIPKKHAQQIVRKIDVFAEDQTAIPTKQLAGYPNLKRFKSGEYRVIFRIENDVLEVHILRIGKRNDGEVYKKLESLE